jgi:PAS domain S-box-containing protein
MLALDYFFVPPLHHVELNLSHLTYFLIFSSFAAVISWFSASRSRAEQELRTVRKQLEQTVADRTAELQRTTNEAVALQQRFRDLVDSVEGIIWEADASNFQFSFVSEQAERFLGYPPAQWLSDPHFWKHHIDLDDRDRVIDSYTRAVVARRNTDCEYRMLAADGHSIWVRDVVSVVVDEDGVARLRGVMLDITRRKHAEAALREKAALLDLTHESIFARDMKGVITYWNRGAEELYGWKAEEVIGKVSYRLLQAVSPEPIEKIHTSLVCSDRWDGEFTHTKANGEQIIVDSRWALQRDESGSPIGVMETNNDVTARKRGDNALRRQASLLDQTHDAVLAWEFPGKIIYWNHAAEQLYGFSREEAIGRRSHELLRTEHPMPTKEFEALIERHGSWTGELTHMTRNNRKLVIESRHVLMREEDGRRLVLETNRDITDRKRAEEKLHQALGDLARISRVTTMGELTASLAHEINQPISAAVMNANVCTRWLQRDQPDVEEARAASSRMVKDVMRAADIIERLRSLYRRSAPQREALHINDIIREMTPLLRHEADRHSVTIRTELDSTLPIITADRVQLQQVLLNLMLNGIEAMKGTGGELIVTSSRAEDDQLLISVTDSGPGLPAEEIERIFEAFFTTKPQGTGMGLSISRNIVESHGGRLWASGNAGRGATFHFTLPQHKPMSSALAA